MSIKNFLFALLALFITSFSHSQNLSYDKKARDEGAKMVEAQMGLVSNPITEEYVSNIGNRLVDQLENRTFDYRFFIVDLTEPNAFSLPGGYIYISRGLLILINDEAELAGIIGHEIIHAHNRHSFKQMKRSIFPGLLKLPGNIIGIANEEFGALINAPIGAATGLTMAKYSRKHEYEADADGLVLAAKAGYNPLALADALSNLNKDVEYLTGQATKFSYFDDHPFTDDRIHKINELSEGLQWQEKESFAQNTEGVYNNLDGIYMSQNPIQGVFHGEKFYHADLGIGISFPEGWNGTNNPQYMGASEPEGKGSIIWGVLPESYDPDVIADAYITKLKKKHKIEAFKSESTVINGFKAHIFAIDEVTGSKVTNMLVCWIASGGYTYQMMGSGDKKFEKDFEATARSFHLLSDQERQMIVGVALRVRKANEGETIEEFSKRTQNAVNTEFTAIINNIPVNKTLSSGQALKIGKVELYNPQ